MTKLKSALSSAETAFQASCGSDWAKGGRSLKANKDRLKAVDTNYYIAKAFEILAIEQITIGNPVNETNNGTTTTSVALTYKQPEDYSGAATGSNTDMVPASLDANSVSSSGIVTTTLTWTALSLGTGGYYWTLSGKYYQRTLTSTATVSGTSGSYTMTVSLTGDKFGLKST